MKGKGYIYIVAALILVVGFSLTIGYNMENQVKKSGGFVISKTDFHDGELDLSARIKEKSEPVINEFTSYVNGQELEGIDGSDFHILIYRLNSQAYEVYFNDLLVGRVGDMENGRSHTYNSANSFSVEKSLIKDNNKITIRSYGIYMTGLELNSVGIVGSAAARKITSVLHIRTSGLTMAGIGAIIFGIMISLLTYLRSERKNKALIYLSAAVFLLGISSLEYLNLTYLSVGYLFFKKIVIVSLYMSIFLFGLAFREYYRQWYLMAVSTSMLAIVMIAAIFTKTLIVFKQIYGITIVGIVISLAVWFIYSLLLKDDTEERLVFATSSFMMLVIALSDMALLIFTGGVVSTSIINHVMIFIFILVIIMNVELHRRNVLLSSESRQRSLFYRQSITDPLTGIFNKKYMISALDEAIPPLSIAMLDLDNFKEINDTYGHQCGDYILEHVAANMKDEFRDSDYMGRYGGDEFMVILSGCSERNAFDIMNRFRMHLEFDKIEYENHDIRVTTSVGITHTREKVDSAKLIRDADKALYRAKNSGRNRVSI